MEQAQRRFSLPSAVALGRILLFKEKKSERKDHRHCEPKGQSIIGEDPCLISEDADL